MTKIELTRELLLQTIVSYGRYVLSWICEDGVPMNGPGWFAFCRITVIL